MNNPSYTRRLLGRDGHFNVEHQGFSCWKLWKADVYHYIVNLGWWKIISLTLVYFVIVNTFFATMYWIELGGIGGTSVDSSWFDAFFFSVQTMSTIGYGNYHPKGFYINAIVCVEAWSSFITNAAITGVIITKIQRPARLRHTMEFSKVAVINTTTKAFKMDNKNYNPTGVYIAGILTFSFRIYNLRKRLLCMPDLRLLLLRKEGKNYVIHELDYDINHQVGRPRLDTLSKPHLQLPWTIVHPINDLSPLYKKSKTEMLQGDYEIICVLDGVDELSSLNFQCRWSYLPHEILLDHEFVPLVARNGDMFTIDYSKLSETVALNDDGSSGNFFADNDESSALVRIDTNYQL